MRKTGTVGKGIYCDAPAPAANMDEESKLKFLISGIITCSAELPLVFPVHPRTMKILKDLGISHSRLHITDPMGYLEFS